LLTPFPLGVKAFGTNNVNSSDVSTFLVIVSLHLNTFVATRVIVMSSFFVNICVGFVDSDVFPSLKFQKYELASIDLFVKLTLTSLLDTKSDLKSKSAIGLE